MQPWYRVVTLREEVREGRSFSPDEFAIALEQVVNGTAPADYSDPDQFFSRTYVTRALEDHVGMTLRRLAGRTGNTAPVLTLVTQFGGGKTHTLTALYHLARAGKDAIKLPGVAKLLMSSGISEAPNARVGVFVGNAWDPSEGRETPWIDLARQIAGDSGVNMLGPSAHTIPPGTEALSRVFAIADAPVLLLFDEVLNFINRHRNMADSFHAFLQNLTVAVSGTTHAAAMISLPRSQVEMTEWDQQWQERVTKVVGRVARDLIANDESDISEVVRRRLFEDLGSDRSRQNVAQAYAKWCLDRSERLPPEWTAVDTAVTATGTQDFLRRRFEACYPFHPATLSVFQRKWRALPQFQQTRGALAMLALWISWAAREQFQQARTEPLITLGSAPLHVPEFRAAVLGQLGESRLDVAIGADIAGETARVKALDADAKGALRDIHRRLGTAILFESSGGQVDKVAHLPELRFALGETDVETTTIDNAVLALERTGFFIRKVGADGYRIHHQATLRKVVSDRRASLDFETEVKPAICRIVEGEFKTGSSVPTVFFPEDSSAIPDSPRLTLIVADPGEEWHPSGQLSERVGRWVKERGASPRLYPAAIVWSAKRPGRELRAAVEEWLAWQRVALELQQGLLGGEIEQSERNEVRARIRDAEDLAKDEVWAGYRYLIISDTSSDDGLRTIDLGAGHSSGNATLYGRVIGALKSEALLNESVGAGYIDRHWPPAFADSGAWPLTSLRQSFLDGSLTRLLDPDVALRRRITEFVESGDFGLASGETNIGGYTRVWYKEPVGAEEVVFEPGVFLLTKAKTEELRATETTPAEPQPVTGPSAVTSPEPSPAIVDEGVDSLLTSPPHQTTLRLSGIVPPEVWNRIGTRILPKLRSGANLTVGIDLSVNVEADRSQDFQLELQLALADLGLEGQVSLDAS